MPTSPRTPETRRRGPNGRFLSRPEPAEQQTDEPVVPAATHEEVTTVPETIPDPAVDEDDDEES